jgi:hypothetical protein
MVSIAVGTGASKGLFELDALEEIGLCQSGLEDLAFFEELLAIGPIDPGTAHTARKMGAARALSS